MKRKRKLDNHDKLLMLWCLAKRNDIIDRYRKATRKYCLTCENWDEVCELRKEAHYNGISDDTLISIDIEVMNSITDEELNIAVYGKKII